MKRFLPQAVLFTVTLGLVLTYALPPDDRADRGSVNRPASKPRPIDLRICAKEIVVQRVIDNRLTLPEAAALFGEVDRLLPMEVPYVLDDESVGRPPATEEERLCRSVACWLRAKPLSAEVHARLDVELGEWLRMGRGRLPDPSGLILSPTSLLAQAREEWLTQSRGVERHPRPTAGGSSHGESTAAGVNETK
ncbi:MAG TPA: hypothetical protein VH120_02140 [Gemmataceae bacterium]|jgi:hypothetical protein|nr:hypothetical protein [Gemmataceae bacterium]